MLRNLPPRPGKRKGSQVRRRRAEQRNRRKRASGTWVFSERHHRPTYTIDHPASPLEGRLGFFKAAPRCRVRSKARTRCRFRPPKPLRPGRKDRSRNRPACEGLRRSAAQRRRPGRKTDLGRNASCWAPNRGQRTRGRRKRRCRKEGNAWRFSESWEGEIPPHYTYRPDRLPTVAMPRIFLFDLGTQKYLHQSIVVVENRPHATPFPFLRTHVVFDDANLRLRAPFLRRHREKVRPGITFVRSLQRPMKIEQAALDFVPVLGVENVHRKVSKGAGQSPPLYLSAQSARHFSRA